MRATSLILTATTFWMAFVRLGAAEPDSPQVLADRIFGNADKNKDAVLDEKEVLEARRIFKAAILQGKKADELPGGKATFEKIEDAATKGKLDAKNGQVSQKEWTEYVKNAFQKKESILKNAKEDIAKRKKDAEERERLERLRRENQELQRKLQQQKKKK
jgi:hypothetical protein